MSAALDPRTATIAAGGTSVSFGSAQARTGSFQVPAAMTGSTVTVKVSNDGTTFTNCPVEGNETAAITFALSGSYSFPQKAFNFNYIQLLSNGTEAAARDFKIFLRD